MSFDPTCPEAEGHSLGVKACLHASRSSLLEWAILSFMALATSPYTPYPCQKSRFTRHEAYPWDFPSLFSPVIGSFTVHRSYAARYNPHRCIQLMPIPTDRLLFYFSVPCVCGEIGESRELSAPRCVNTFAVRWVVSHEAPHGFPTQPSMMHDQTHIRRPCLTLY